MKKFVKVMCMALVLVMAMGCFAACGGSNAGEYVIGVSGPLTGPAAVYGQAVKNSAQMAVDEINAAGGVNGVMLKLVVKDDKHDPANIAANYAALVEEGMNISLGTVTTAPGLEFTALAKEDNLFFLTPSASGDAIPGSHGYQMCFADGNQGKVAAEYVNANYAGKTIGIFYKSDDPYSMGIYEKFVANLSGVDTVVTSFTAANESSFTTQIDTLKDCEFVFMPIYAAPAALFMTQAKNVMNADAVYYGCDGFDGIESIEGFDINAVPQEVSMLSHFNSKATEGAAKTYVDKYVEKYGKDTLNQFGASAYDCVYAIKAALEAAGDSVNPNMDASEICDVLKAQFNGGFTFANGATGASIKWNADGSVNKQAVKFVVKVADSAK